MSRGLLVGKCVISLDGMQGVTPAATSKRKRGQDEEPAQPNGTAAAEDPSEDESEDDVMDGPTFQERLAAAGLAEQVSCQERPLGCRWVQLPALLCPISISTIHVAGY